MPSLQETMNQLALREEKESKEIPPDRIDLKASHSEVESFKACPRRHWYNYGLKIQPNNPGVQLVRGTIGHSALAEYYEKLRDGAGHRASVKASFELLAVQIDGVGDFYKKDDLRAELAITLRDYFRWVEPEAEEIRVLHVEKEFNVTIDGIDDPDFSVPFIVDLILDRPGLGIEAWDHKFVFNFFSDKTADMSPQLPLYIAGLQMLGIDANAARYNEIRYRKTKDIEADYTNRFNRPKPRITPARVISTLEDHIRLGRLLYNLKSLGIEDWEKMTWRNGGKSCDYCDFQKICNGELNGESRDLFIGVDYQPKQIRR